MVYWFHQRIVFKSFEKKYLTNLQFQLKTKFRSMETNFKNTKIYFYLNKVKFFGLRKIYYLLRKFLPFLFFQSLVNDLEFISQKDKEKLVKEITTELFQVKGVKAIYEYGGRSYRTGFSDIDLVVIIEKKERVDFSAIRDIFGQYKRSSLIGNYLLWHFFYIVSEDIFLNMVFFI